MPAQHARFLEQLLGTTIRNFVLSHNVDHPINDAYNSAIAMLTAFRDKHIQIVTRYIILPSRASLPNNEKLGVFNLAVGSQGSESLGLHGTGGTKLMPFLKQTRDETKDTAIYRS
jgi:indoleamine 2,3-dioxygenase